jgi:membrane protein required for colicin V production
LFDIIGLALLGVSALVGLARGFLREVTMVAALIVAGLAALYGLRYVGPPARAVVHPAWMGDIAAVLIVFLAVYIVLRVVSVAMIRRLHDSSGLGAVDRMAGGGLGLLRGLIILGIIDIGIHLAPPAGGVPAWITSARLFPVAERSGAAVRSIAPKGSQIANRLRPEIEKAMKSGEGDPNSGAGGGAAHETRYGHAARKGLDDVVERTR